MLLIPTADAIANQIDGSPVARAFYPRILEVRIRGPPVSLTVGENSLPLSIETLLRYMTQFQD